ncbi:hypothetical protein AAVH_32196 [Aphelenchoides avenae]|nr:hypothetical protein AAVH_32196 [Aphelenchus avenae]
MTNLAEQLRLSFNCSESDLALEYRKNFANARQKIINWIFAQNNARLWYKVLEQDVRFVGLFYQNMYDMRTPDNTESLKDAFEKAGYNIKYPELPVAVIECIHCTCRTHYMAPLELLY